MYIFNIFQNLTKKQTKVVQPLQLYDLLQLSRQEKETRDLCRTALRKFDQWKKSMPDTIHPFVSAHIHVKNRRLRAQVWDAVRIYKAIRRTRTVFFRSYIEGLPEIQSYKRLAS